MAIRWEIILASSISLVFIVVIIQVVSVNLFTSTQHSVQEVTKEIIYDGVKQRLLAIGQNESKKISSEINKALQSARTMSYSIYSLRQDNERQRAESERLRLRITQLLAVRSRTIR